MRQSALKVLNNVKQRDFFGIHDITNKDIAGAFATRSKLPPQAIEEKYDPLFKSRNRLINEEKDEDAIFGRIRYDSNNKTMKHGQYEENATERLHDTIAIKQMFMPDGENSKQTAEQGIEDSPPPDKYGAPFRISEVEPVQAMSEILQLFKSQDDAIRLATVYKNQPPITFCFRDAANVSEPTEESSHPRQLSKELIRHARIIANRRLQRESFQTPVDVNKSPKPDCDPMSDPEIDIRRPQEDLDALAGPDGAKAPFHELDVTSQEYEERREEEMSKKDRFDKALDRKYDVPEKDGKSENAMDYLRKVRSQKVEPASTRLKKSLKHPEKVFTLNSVIKLDSQGFRIYTHQVPDWSSVRRVEILDYLRRSIIYNNYDVLAINKPYGISSHTSPGGRDELNVDDLMKDVANKMRINDIYLAHRLDKTTTGVLLFATSKERARELNKLFKADEIKKTYWCITTGVPNPPKGILDLPLGEFEVAGKMRTCPVPVSFQDDKQLAQRFREARRAITEYRVLDSRSNVALVELRPQSGVKHQLRCHMGFGLKTPILGDHKYSHLTKLAPQKLAPSTLEALHLRQEKVRTLPVHLHSKAIVLPGLKANGETLFISAPLPRHFADNMRALKLSGGDQ